MPNCKIPGGAAGSSVLVRLSGRRPRLKDRVPPQSKVHCMVVGGGQEEEWKAAALRCQNRRLNFQEPSKTSGCRACRPWPSMDGAMAATAIYSSVAGWLCSLGADARASGPAWALLSRMKSWRIPVYGSRAGKERLVPKKVLEPQLEPLGFPRTVS